MRRILVSARPSWLIATVLIMAVGSATPGTLSQEPVERDVWLEADDEVPGALDAPGEPEEPGVDLTAARNLVRASKLEEAARKLETLRAENPDDPDLLILLGEVHVASKRFDEGIEVLTAAKELAPDRERIHFQLGTALASLGKPEEALAAFEGELTRSEDPQVLVLTRLNRSLLLQRFNRWADAAAELESVLQFEPDRANVYGDLASLYIQAGETDLALRALERGRDVGFGSAPHWYSVGARLFAENRFDEAAEAFTGALEVSPDRPDAERSLAATLDRLGRTDEAAAHFRRYLELKPDAADREKVERQLADYGDSHP